MKAKILLIFSVLLLLSGFGVLFYPTAKTAALHHAEQLAIEEFERYRSNAIPTQDNETLGPEQPSTSMIHAACDRALITLFQNQEEILRTLIAGLERLHERENHTQARIYEIDATMQVLRRQLHTLSSLQAQGILDAADFADQTRILNQRVSALRTERQQILNYEGSDDALKELYALSDALQDADEQACLEDEALRLELIKKIYVRSETDIDIVLPGGLILPERLPLLKKRCKRS